MTTKKQAQEREEARAFLRERIKPGDTVWTQLLHASRSGMSRTIAPIVKDRDGEPWNAFGYVAKATNNAVDRDRGGVKVSGAGMDIGFALVYDLSHALWPEYDCLGRGDAVEWGKQCPSNAHQPGNRRDEKRHKDGYALRHRWL